MSYENEASPMDYSFKVYAYEERPERDQIISKDDILNICILLNSEYDSQRVIDQI